MVALTPKERTDKWRKAHPEQYKALRREYFKKHPGKKRSYHMKYNYGITQKDYDAILLSQMGVCAICGYRSDGVLHVDHNHETGKVRGLLCSNCNRAIGLLKDSPGILRAAALYLERG